MILRLTRWKQAGPGRGIRPRKRSLYRYCTLGLASFPDGCVRDACEVRPCDPCVRVSVCPVCPLCSEITHRHTFIYWYCTCTVSVIISPSSSNCRKSIHKQQTTLRQPIECAPSDGTGSKTMPTPLVQPCQLRRAVPSRSLAPEGSGGEGRRGTTDFRLPTSDFYYLT